MTEFNHKLVHHTPRLELIAAELPIARALAEKKHDVAGRLLNARIPAEWPPEYMDDDALNWIVRALEADPASAAWGYWYAVTRSDRTLVGGVGYKGPPRDGRVDVGYGIIKPFQRRGLATEATQGLVDRAFADQRVDRIVGETFPHLAASIGVMEKLGFRLVNASTASFEGTEVVAQYELRRPLPAAQRGRSS